MDLPVLTRWGRRDHMARDAGITAAVLLGDTLSAASKEYGVTPNRVRMIVHKYCRLANKEKYDQLQTLSNLRANRGLFLSKMPQSAKNA